MGRIKIATEENHRLLKMESSCFLGLKARSSASVLGVQPVPFGGTSIMLLPLSRKLEAPLLLMLPELPRSLLGKKMPYHLL